MLVAGAGTGKTTVLTRRIAHLIASKRARPSEILALTFTEKAAGEMEARVDRLVPYGFVDVRVSTFHALGDGLLREFALEAGLLPDFKVLTQAEASVFLNRRWFELPLERLRPLANPLKYAYQILGSISRAKDEGVSAADYLRWAEDRLARALDPEAMAVAGLHREAARAYARYEELKGQEGLCDFGDQILRLVGLLRSNPSILGKVRSRFKYVLVDEFQDTNFIQFELVQLLAGGHRNLTVVLDDDQAIYKFRGACLANILGFRKVYPDAKVLTLTENYRSTQTILDAAYRLIRQNDPDRLEVSSGVSKRLRSQTGPGPRIVCKGFGLQSEEADWAARRIQEGVETSGGGRAYGDYAVLVRSNDGARPYLAALGSLGIPCRAPSREGLLRSRELRPLFSFLRALADPHDSVYLYDLAVSRFYGISPEDLAPFHHACRASHRPLFELLARPDLHQGIWNSVGEVEATRLQAFIRDFRNHLEASGREPVGRVLYDFLAGKGVLEELARGEGPDSTRQAQALAALFGALKRFAEMSLVDRPQTLVENLEMALEEGLDAQALDAEEDRVSVLTVHKAKGLEFPVVFLANLVEDQFPARRRGEFLPLPEELLSEPVPSGDTHLAEERRLFYVGMTRAREELWLTWARGSGLRPRRPSRFIVEALELPRDAFDPPKADGRYLEGIRRSVTVSPPEPHRAGAAPGEVPLTAYAVDDYLTCPYKYRLAHILKVPVASDHAVRYGAAIHEAIRAFNQSRLSGPLLALEGMLRVFERAWVSEGYLSREHEEARLARGREVLCAFYERESGRPAPKAVEEPFRFYLDQNRISGRFDCIEDRPEGAVVVDYKSGEAKDAKDADRKVKESLQMGLYALGFAAKFGRLPAGLELQFLDSGHAGVLPNPSEKWLEGARSKIRTAAAGIRAGSFGARPDYMNCSICAYRRICPEAYGRGSP